MATIGTASSMVEGVIVCTQHQISSNALKFYPVVMYVCFRAWPCKTATANDVYFIGSFVAICRLLYCKVWHFHISLVVNHQLLWTIFAGSLATWLFYDILLWLDLIVEWIVMTHRYMWSVSIIFSKFTNMSIYLFYRLIKICLIIIKVVGCIKPLSFLIFELNKLLKVSICLPVF